MIVTALIGGVVAFVVMMAMEKRPSRLRLAQGRMRLGRLAGPTRADLFVDHEMMRGRLSDGSTRPRSMTAEEWEAWERAAAGDSPARLRRVRRIRASAEGLPS